MPYMYMKTNIFNLSKLAVIALALQFTCCADRFSSWYTLEFPRSPQSWVSILGEPHWRVEWLAPDGRRQSADLSPGGSLQIELPSTWVNPVIARPYWPGHNLYAGLFMPAGALFPFDVNKNRLCLSWEAGTDAVFYWELASANGGNMSRIPANFDWSRFRELFKSETLREDVREDPWLVDWSAVAESTVSSTFYQSRLRPEAAASATLPVPAGPWYGASPFSQPLYFAEDEARIFQVRAGVNTWVSAAGILRVNGGAWVFREW